MSYMLLWFNSFTYSVRNTRIRGAAKSLIPYTYPLAGCLIYHMNRIRTIIIYRIGVLNSLRSGYVRYTSIRICFICFFSFWVFFLLFLFFVFVLFCFFFLLCV